MVRRYNILRVREFAVAARLARGTGRQSPKKPVFVFFSDQSLAWAAFGYSFVLFFVLYFTLLFRQINEFGFEIAFLKIIMIYLVILFVSCGGWFTFVGGEFKNFETPADAKKKLRQMLYADLLLMPLITVHLGGYTALILSAALVGAIERHAFTTGYLFFRDDTDGADPPASTTDADQVRK